MSNAMDIQLYPDLGKASTGACGYFDRNPANFEDILSKIHHNIGQGWRKKS